LIWTVDTDVVMLCVYVCVSGTGISASTVILAFEAGKNLQYLLPALQQRGQGHCKYSVMDVTLWQLLKLSVAQDHTPNEVVKTIERPARCLQGTTMSS